MHESVLAFAQQHAELARGADVAEIGSLWVNGSVKDVLGPPVAASWLGVDLLVGPGVDLVADGEQLPEEWSDRFGFTCSMECLEHAMRPHRVLGEMARVTAPGGYVMVSIRGFDEARGFFPFHNPPDRHRFGPGVLHAYLEDVGLAVDVVCADPQVPGWFGLARKLA